MMSITMVLPPTVTIPNDMPCMMRSMMNKVRKPATM